MSHQHLADARSAFGCNHPDAFDQRAHGALARKPLDESQLKARDGCAILAADNYPVVHVALDLAERERIGFECLKIIAASSEGVVWQHGDDRRQIPGAGFSKAHIAHSTVPMRPASTSSGAAITMRPAFTSIVGTFSRVKARSTVSPSGRSISSTSPAP